MHLGAGANACGLRHGVEVVHHLRQEPADVHGVGRRQAHLATKIGVGKRLFRQPVTVVEAPVHGVRPDIPILRVEHRQLGFLRRADTTIRVEHDNPCMGDAVKRVRDRTPRVARRGGQHRQRLIAGVERRHEPRHRPRANILERQRRPVKELERVDAGRHFHERYREIQSLDDDRFERRGVEFGTRVGTQRTIRNLGERAIRQAFQLGVAPRLDRLRYIKTAVRSQSIQHRRSKRDAHGPARARGCVRLAAARRYESHVDTTRAPWPEMREM